MQFIDEENDILGPADLGHHSLDSLFKLAAVLGSGNHHRQVEDYNSPSPENFGDTAADNVLRKTFDNRSFSDARLAKKDGIVLGSTAQDLDHALDLIMTPDNRVQLALSCQLGQIPAKGIEGRCLGTALLSFGRRLWDGALGLRVGPKQFQHLEPHVFKLQIQIEEDLRGNSIVLPDQAKEEMLRTDVVVAQFVGLFHRQLEHLLCTRGKRKLAHGDHRRSGLDILFDLGANLADLYAQVLQDIGSDPATLLDQPKQYVFGADEVMVEPLRFLPRESHDLTGSICETVEHLTSTSSSAFSPRSNS